VQQSRTLIFGAPRVDGASSSSDFQRATVAAFLADWVPRTGRGPACDCCPWFLTSWRWPAPLRCRSWIT